MHRCVLVTAAALLIMGLMVVVFIHACRFASVVAYALCNLFKIAMAKAQRCSLFVFTIHDASPPMVEFSRIIIQST